jgi:putative thioredoxin
MAGSSWVVEVTADTFQQLVIDASRERPVVVDFWAPWCGPCRALGPVLEKLAAEMGGVFLLAKINTDENPELAGAFQVNGIPAVYALRDGQLVSRFEGLLPEDQVRRFLAEVTGGGGGSPAETALELEGRDPAAAAAAYREALAADPNDYAARVGLARVLLAGDGHEAEAAGLLAPVEVGEYVTEAERLRTVIKLREVPHTDADLAAARSAVSAKPDDAAARLRLGRVLAARGEYLPALDELLESAGRDKELARGDVRAAMVDVFTVIGPRSPEADEYRRKLQGMLY